MKKCLGNGMSVDLFRSGTAKKGQQRALVPIRSPNLLRNDQSTLTPDQWTHLTNIVNCYDEYSYQSFARSFIDDQNRLPMKIRFRSTSILELILKVAAGGQSLFERNVDFLRLTPVDRSTLVRKTVRTVNGVHTAFTGFVANFLEIPSCRTTLDMMYGPVASEACFRTGSRLDSDMVFVKLILSSLMFSTFHLTDFNLEHSMNLHDVRTAVRIQDRYIELAWRYMTHKYNYERTVRSFSNLVLSLLAFYECLTEIMKREDYNSMVENLAKNTEQIVLTNN